MEKEKIITLVRLPVSKILTRVVLYGLVSKLGFEVSEAESFSETIGYGIATVVSILIAILIDKWHHKKDTTK